jgi:hypothetical protein
LGGTIAKAPMQKLIAFDDETSALLRQLGHDRMATLQELADEAFADLLKKHGVPLDLKDALRKSVRRNEAPHSAAGTDSDKGNSPHRGRRAQRSNRMRRSSES